MLSLLGVSVPAAPIFDFVVSGDMPAEAQAAFAAAGARWSNLLADDVTITIEISFADLSAGVLGGASSTMYYAPYASVNALLGLDATSPDDAIANAHLQAGPLVAMMNYSEEHPGATPQVDNDNNGNNNYMLFTSANGRALGFDIPSGNDATIQFNTDYASVFDYNPDDGIGAGQLDFVGIATHEIGHVLGFVSGVDTRDYNPDAYSENQVDILSTPLDLYRYSANGVLDWSVGGTPYFSIDGGATSIELFATGKNLGDGFQASHWQNNAPGIMDPNFAYGQLGQLTALDLQAVDVIGWDLAAFAVPEPGGVLLAGSGLLAAILWRRRRGRRG